MSYIKDISEDELISKINEFSKLARENRLSIEDEKQRQLYRKEYIRRVKLSLAGNLDNIQIQ